MIARWQMDHHIALCGACGLRFAAETPSATQLEEFYQGFLYRKPKTHELNRLLTEKRREIRRLFQLVARDTQSKQFLDHGGGTGAAYQAAKDLGLEAFFQEIDEQAIAFVKETFGLDEEHLLTDPKAPAGKQFDYVLSDNVLEHVPSPVDSVRSLFALLAPGGTLIVKTPHGGNGELFFHPKITVLGYTRKAIRYNGWRRGLLASFVHRIWTCDPPRHLFSFSAKNLQEIARGAGIPAGDFAIEYYRIPLLEYSLTGALFSRPNGLAGVIKRIVVLPLVSLELATKVLQWCLARVNLISPAGIILRVAKPAPRSEAGTSSESAVRIRPKRAAPTSCVVGADITSATIESSLKKAPVGWQDE